MTGKAEVSLSHLFSSAKLLNDVSDKISAQIKDIETALAARGVGVTAWISLKSWDEEVGDHTLNYTASLGYAKHNGRWGLLHEVYCDQFGEATTSFLRDVAREVRIDALEKLPDLFDRLAEETQKLTETAHRNLSVAREITAALNSNGR